MPLTPLSIFTLTVGARPAAARTGYARKAPPCAKRVAVQCPTPQCPDADGNQAMRLWPKACVTLLLPDTS